MGNLSFKHELNTDEKQHEKNKLWNTEGETYLLQMKWIKFKFINLSNAAKSTNSFYLKL